MKLDREDLEEAEPEPMPSAEPPIERKPRRTWQLVALGLLFLAVLATLAASGIPVVDQMATILCVVLAAFGLLWLTFRILQLFLWKVGRRLAFSYFLIGVLPFPMATLLLGMVGYLMAGFFLGHLYQSAATELERELVVEAEAALAHYDTVDTPPMSESKDLRFDYYRRGQRQQGAGISPQAWPQWLSDPPMDGTEALARSVALDDGRPGLAVAVEQGELGVTVVKVGDRAATLRRRGGFWAETVRSEHEWNHIQLGGSGITFRSADNEALTIDTAAAEAFFHSEQSDPGLLDSPIIAWMQLLTPEVGLSDGEERPGAQVVVLRSTPRHLASRIFQTRSELDGVAWLGLITLSTILLGIYAVAVIVAATMIFGLSRAVNQLSTATQAVQSGDFACRIDVRRRDQIGALHQSFNSMAANLQAQVAERTQMEVLERELEIAREVQESLVPTALPHGDSVEFASLFRPSAAIGGDYFDVLRLDDQRLMVAIADVSGHGLSSGLRMAMIKAALSILIEERQDARALLTRLDALVRAGGVPRGFVTATLAVIDLEHARVEITNAGHPPTYLLRDCQVEEIALPSPPLGLLGNDYVTRTIELQPGDVLVWLSDGLIEMASPDGVQFGYESVVRALTSCEPTANGVREALLEAVARHASGRPADDDCTLVVMRYRDRETEAAEDSDETPSVEAASSSPSVR